MDKPNATPLIGPLWVLLRLPWQRYLLAMIFMSLLILVGWSLPILIGKPKAVYGSLGMHAYALMFVGMLSGMVWSSVCRPETQALPGFRRALALVWLLHLLLLIVAPGIATQVALGQYGLLVSTGLLLLTATALATGTGIKWAALVWFAPMFLGIWPEVGKHVWFALRDYPLSALPLAGVAGLILLTIWRRLLTVSDAAPTLSPADISASDLRHGPEAMRANATGFARWIIDFQSRLSAAAFDRVLARLQRGRASAERAALSMVLMPNLHWRGIVLEVLITGLLGGLVVLMIGAQRGGPPPANMVASYVGVITAMRFQQLHRSSMILRPSLTDVYLAMAPPSQTAFARAIARALRGSVVGAVIFAGSLLGLIAFLMYPAELRTGLIVGGLLGATAASLFGLGVVLLLLDSEKPRVFAGLFALGLLGAMPTSFTAMASMASLGAGIATGTVWIVIALGFVYYAERQVERWGIRFDVAV